MEDLTSPSPTLAPIVKLEPTSMALLEVYLLGIVDRPFTLSSNIHSWHSNKNFRSWHQWIINYLQAKSKFGFINGNISSKSTKEFDSVDMG